MGRKSGGRLSGGGGDGRATIIVATSMKVKAMMYISNNHGVPRTAETRQQDKGRIPMRLVQQDLMT
jgi:hypothetical protein